jgi:uncharacterized protein YecE (DUF72 family)
VELTLNRSERFYSLGVRLPKGTDHSLPGRIARVGPLQGTLIKAPCWGRGLMQHFSPGVMTRILIGTSGWHYDSWRGPFFPKGLPLKNQLPFYAGRFGTTELNGVFYRTPSLDAVRTWRDQTGENFVFAWKASKFITHWKRLSNNSVNSLALIEERLSVLGKKAGPILFQLPPNFEVDTEKLASFFKLLSKERRYSFEFRHPSWYQPRVFKLLSESNVALCLSDHHDAPSPWKRTADFIYIRAHGPGGRYKGHYRSQTMSEWAKRIRSWKKQGCDVFVYSTTIRRAPLPQMRSS